MTDVAPVAAPLPAWQALLQRPGAWLWLALLAGALLRLYLIVATGGTYDVPIWTDHARGVHDLGLAEYYHHGRKFNHPPAIGLFLSALWSLGQALDIPFRVLLRAPFALLDLGTALLLLRLLRGSPWRYAITAVYWLCPLSILYSAYHGNTDGAVAFLALLAALLATKGRAGAAGAAIGVGLAVKLPIILAVPVIFFALPDWRAQARLTASALVVALALYLPGLVQDAAIVIQNVFLYGGQNIQTRAGVQVWGIQNFYPVLFALPYAWHDEIRAVTQGYYAFNTPVCLLLVTLLAWLRRRERSPRALGASLGMAFAIFYGFTNYWSFQYFAWSLPFLLCLDFRFALPALALMSAYIYGLYAWLCGGLSLSGDWDFVGHPLWPLWLLALRDACIALFFVAGCCFLWLAVRGELRSRREHGSDWPSTAERI